METVTDLKKTVAVLESKLDLMEAELYHLHDLLIKCGFVHGIYTLKSTVEEFLKEGDRDSSEEKPLSQSEGS